MVCVGIDRKEELKVWLRDKTEEDIINRLIELESECIILKAQIGNKGKSHIRGDAEFYEAIIEANKRVYTKAYKNGVRYIYKECLVYARGSKSIVDYCAKYNLKLNRENIKNWYEIAESLKLGIDAGVKIGNLKEQNSNV